MRKKLRNRLLYLLLVYIQMVYLMAYPIQSIRYKPVFTGAFIVKKFEGIKLNMFWKDINKNSAIWAKYRAQEQILYQEQKPKELIIIGKAANTMANRSGTNRQVKTIAELIKLSYIDVRNKSGLSINQIKTILKGTGLDGLERAFYNAENINGVNALFMIALAALESGWGNSWMAKNKHNLFGFQAYDSDTSKAKVFKDKSECIEYVSKYLHDNYLTETGKYFNGYSIKAINGLYASDKEWNNKIVSLIEYNLNKIKQ